MSVNLNPTDWSEVTSYLTGALLQFFDANALGSAVVIDGTILYQLDNTAGQYLTDQRYIDISIFIDRYVPLLKLSAKKDAWGHFLIITSEMFYFCALMSFWAIQFFNKMLNVLLP